jgi:hypothetical protein
MNNISIAISGLQHEFILNCALKIMTIIIEGNTSKVEGIIKYAGCNIPILNNKTIYDYIKTTDLEWYFHTYKEEYNKLFIFMQNQQKLTIDNLINNKPIYSETRHYKIINKELSDMIPLYIIS